MGRVSFIGRAAHATLHMILSEQVIGLGMGSWLDLWEKMIMYVLRHASCACNFTLHSGVLASLMEALHWPSTDQPAVNLKASI